MSLTNPNTPVSQQDLQDFYHKLLPYMGGSSGGGGHTIEDSEGTDLTQRDTLQFGEGFIAEDDSENEKTVISPDVMQSGDMDDVVTPLPSVQPRYQKYSTEEQVIGEWIDGKPLYQKTISLGNLPNATEKWVDLNVANLDTIVNHFGMASNGTNLLSIPYVSDNTTYVNTWFSKTQVRITAKSDRSAFTGYLTIQYTKTTD